MGNVFASKYGVEFIVNGGCKISIKPDNRKYEIYRDQKYVEGSVMRLEYYNTDEPDTRLEVTFKFDSKQLGKRIDYVVEIEGTEGFEVMYWNKACKYKGWSITMEQIKASNENDPIGVVANFGK